MSRRDRARREQPEAHEDHFAERLARPGAPHLIVGSGEVTTKFSITCQRCRDRILSIELAADSPRLINERLLLDDLHKHMMRDADQVRPTDDGHGHSYVYLYSCDRCGRSGIQVSAARAGSELLTAWRTAQQTGKPQAFNLSA